MNLKSSAAKTLRKMQECKQFLVDERRQNGGLGGTISEIQLVSLRVFVKLVSHVSRVVVFNQSPSQGRKRVVELYLVLRESVVVCIVDISETGHSTIPICQIDARDSNDQCIIGA